MELYLGEIAKALEIWNDMQNEYDSGNPHDRLLRNLPTAIREELTDRQREFLLLHLKGVSVTEIGRQLGVETSTASKTLKCAYAKLRRALRYSL